MCIRDRGYGFGAEGDWKTACLYRTLWVMNQGLAKGCSFLEDYTLNFAADRTSSPVSYPHLMKNLYIRQVGAFGRIDRDPGERVISIAYCTLINVKDYDDLSLIHISLSR